MALNSSNSSNYLEQLGLKGLRRAQTELRFRSPRVWCSRTQSFLRRRLSIQNDRTDKHFVSSKLQKNTHRLFDYVTNEIGLRLQKITYTVCFVMWLSEPSKIRSDWTSGIGRGWCRMIKCMYLVLQFTVGLSYCVLLSRTLTPSA